jgi:hypothetical protein
MRVNSQPASQTEPIETALYIQDKNDGIFKGLYRPARGPAPRYRLSKNRGRSTNQHRCVQIPLKYLLGVSAIEREAYLRKILAALGFFVANGRP